MSIIIAGPCGVGKSTVAKLLAEQAKLKYLDFDEIRSAKKNSMPCWLNQLQIIECLSSELENFGKDFVLDIGGGTVFRPNTDNSERLRQILELKSSYLARIVVITADHDILFKRYLSAKQDLSGKQHNTLHFENAWSDWIAIEQPYWQQCAELTIDTTSLTVMNTLKMINNEFDR